jgi:hypothetical protein
VYVKWKVYIKNQRSFTNSVNCSYDLLLDQHTHKLITTRLKLLLIQSIMHCSTGINALAILDVMICHLSFTLKFTGQYLLSTNHPKNTSNINLK